MKRNIVVLLALAILVQGLAALPPDDVRLSSYADWSRTPWPSKVAYVNGALVGCWYVAAAYAHENQFKEVPDIVHLVPYGIMADQLAKLIDQVYMDERNRTIPIIRIIVDWKAFSARYGAGL